LRLRQPAGADVLADTGRPGAAAHAPHAGPRESTHARARRATFGGALCWLLGDACWMNTKTSGASSKALEAVGWPAGLRFTMPPSHPRNDFMVGLGSCCRRPGSLVATPPPAA
jgi:hypothetical protein